MGFLMYQHGPFLGGCYRNVEPQASFQRPKRLLDVERLQGGMAKLVRAA